MYVLQTSIIVNFSGKSLSSLHSYQLSSNNTHELRFLKQLVKQTILESLTILLVFTYNRIIIAFPVSLV